MNFGRTLVFILLFFVVMTVYLYEKRLEKQILEKVPDEVRRQVSFSPKDRINRIELIHHGSAEPAPKIILLLKNGKWRLESPVKAPAEPTVIEGLAASAMWISKQPRLRVEKGLEEYGLAKPELEVVFGLSASKPEENEDAPRSEILSLGNQAPVGNTIYARWGSEQGYLLLPGEIKSVFEQTVYGMREKRLFCLPEKDYAKIFIEVGNQSYQWKKDGDAWFWLEPVSRLGQKVPAPLIQSVLGVLQGLYIKEFLDTNQASKAELGFFMIHDRIWVESAQGTKTTVHFGNEVPMQNAYYGFREGDPGVFLLDRGKVIQFWDLLQTIGKTSATATQEAVPQGAVSPQAGHVA